VGDVDQFIKEWPLHPEWQEPGWRAYARALAKTGHERDAVTTALRFMSAPNIPNPPAPQDLDNAANQFQANPQDLYSGILLYSAQKSKGLNDQALATLLALAKLPQRPSYIPYLLAKDLLQADQDKPHGKPWNPCSMISNQKRSHGLTAQPGSYRGACSLSCGSWPSANWTSNGRSIPSTNTGGLSRFNPSFVVARLARETPAERSPCLASIALHHRSLCDLGASSANHSGSQS